MKISLVHLINIILVLISFIYFTYVIINYPLIGIKAVPLGNNLCQVTDIQKNGWAYFNGIEEGSLIQCLDTIPDNKWYKIEKISTIQIESSQHTESKVINYKSIPISFTIYNLLPIFYFLLILISTLIFYYKSRKSKLNITIILILITFSMAYLSGWASARDDFYGILVCTFSLLSIPILIFDYLNQIIEKKKQIPLIPKLHNLYIMVLLITVTDCIFYKLKIITESLSLIVFSMLLISLLVFTVWNYKEYMRLVNSVRTKYLMWIIFFSFIPFLFFYVTPYILNNDPILSAEITSLFLLFIPLGLLFVSMSRFFLDIDYLIKHLGINVIFSLLAVCVLAVLYLKNTDITLTSLFLSIIIILIIMSIKDFATPYINNKQIIMQNYSLSRFSKSNREANTIADIIANLESEFKAVLKIKKVNELFYHYGNQRFCSKEDIKENILNVIYKKIKNNQLEVGDLLPIPSGYALFILSGEVFTFLLLPYKKNLLKLTSKEKEWVKTIALQTNLLLENFKRSDELLLEMNVNQTKIYSPTFSRVLFSIGEIERTKLSQNIHDSILQELISLQKALEIIEHKQRVEIQDVQTIKLNVESQIFSIREICYDLRPPFLKERGLIEIVLILIRKTEKISKFKIEFYYDGYLNETNLDEEISIHIYRIIQELLINARKHSQANFVYIALKRQINTLTLLYEDDGIGIKNIEKNENNFGLFNIRERVKSINGELFLSSIPNEGTILRVIIQI
jgi:two-component system sensor histidine kinase ComP